MTSDHQPERPPGQEWDEFLRRRSPAIFIPLGLMAAVPLLPGELRVACALGSVVLIFLYVHLRQRRNIAIGAAREAERRRIAAEEDALARESAALEMEVFEGNDDKVLPDLSTEVVGVLLHPGERCIALSSQVARIVERKHTLRTQGERYTEEWEEVSDRGRLYVTDQRIILAGSREIVSVPTQRVGDVDVDGNRLCVLVENRARPLLLDIQEPYRAQVLAAACMRAAMMAAKRKRFKRAYLAES